MLDSLFQVGSEFIKLEKKEKRKKATANPINPCLGISDRKTDGNGAKAHL